MTRSLPGAARLRACCLSLGLVPFLLGCSAATPEQHVERARSYLGEQDVAAAAIELKNALQKAPDLAEARFLLGRTHMLTGDYASAQKELERALDLGFDPGAIRVDLLRAKVKVGNYHEVIGELEGSEGLEPAVAVVLGEAYLRAGDAERARRVFELGSDSSHGNLGLGNVAWAAGDADGARSHLTQAVQLDGHNLDAWIALGEVELAQRDLEQAAEAYASAGELPGGRIVGRLGLARVEIARGELGVAAKHVEAVRREARNHPLANYLDGLIKLRGEDLQGAESALLEVLRTAPDHVPSMYLLGVVKYRQGQLNQAQDYLQRYLSRAPGNESAAKLLGSIRLEAADYRGVVGALEPLVAQSRDPQLLSLYGSAQLRLGNPSGATQALEKAVALRPEQSAFRNQLAASFLAGGDPSLAEAELETAIDVGTDQLSSEFMLAMVRIRERDYEGAARVVEAIVGKNPDSPVGYNLRGGIAMGRGDRAAAKQAFETALERDPAYAPAVANLANMAEEEGDLRGAAARYETLLNVDENNTVALLGLSDLAEKRGDDAGALEYAARAAESNPAALGTHLRVARLSLKGDDVARAHEASEAALSVAPRSTDALFVRADVDIRRGDVPAAARRANELQSMAAGRRDDAPFLLSLGLLQSKLNNLPEARRNFETLLEATDTHDVAALGGLASIAVKEGNVPAAEDLLKRLEQLNDRGPAVTFLRAELARLKGDAQTAESLYGSLADLGVRDGALRLASLHFSRNDDESAIRELSGWLASHENDQGVRRQLADALMKRGDHQAALEHYEKLAEGDDPEVLNNLAWLYQENGDARALATARRAQRLSPKNAAIADTLGWILVTSGEVREGLVHLRRSAQLAPGNPFIQYHLGVAHQKNGDALAARAAFERALASEAFRNAEEGRLAQQQLEGL